MKKILVKDKKLRTYLKNNEKIFFILQCIANNSNFSKFIRWKAVQKIKICNYHKSKSLLSNRCVKTINKKRFSKLTVYSRQLFLKLIRDGKIYGFQKSSW
jgi:ribosomal protein S14